MDYYDAPNNCYNWKKHRGRLGTIVGESRSGRCWVVLWDGNKSKQLSHKSYIEFSVSFESVPIEKIATQLIEINDTYNAINEQREDPRKY